MVKWLSFMNLLDSEGKLSITNLAMYVIIGKVCAGPLDWSSAVTLFVVCANYMHKRASVKPEDNTAVADMVKQIEDLKSSVTNLAMRVIK